MIIKRLLALFPLIMLSVYSSVAFSKVIKIQEANYRIINEKLALHLELEPLKKATGFYSMDKEKLHGDFDLGEEYTGHDEQQNAFYLYKNKVKGSYVYGKKEGAWHYSYVFDDGLDMFERHDITIHYKNGKCTKSQFDGVIGHKMPITKHDFSDPSLCTPSKIREKAWQIWSEQYDKAT